MRFPWKRRESPDEAVLDIQEQLFHMLTASAEGAVAHIFGVSEDECPHEGDRAVAWHVGYGVGEVLIEPPPDPSTPQLLNGHGEVIEL